MSDVTDPKRRWLDRLAASGVPAEGLNELEAHLDETLADLTAKGLSHEEAFLVAAHRLGPAEAVGGEYRKVYAGPARRRVAAWLIGFITSCGLFTAVATSRAFDAGWLLRDGPNDEAAFALLIAAYAAPLLAAVLTVGLIRLFWDEAREAVARFRSGGVLPLLRQLVPWTTAAVASVVAVSLVVLALAGRPADSSALLVVVGAAVVPVLFLIAGGVGLVRIAGDIGRALATPDVARARYDSHAPTPAPE